MICAASLWSSGLCPGGIAPRRRQQQQRHQLLRLQVDWRDYDEGGYVDDDSVEMPSSSAFIIGEDPLLGPNPLAEDMDELKSLVSEWQEQQAIQDESGGPTSASQQASMMASWRRLLAKRERDLVRSAAAGRQKSVGWVPAALTGECAH